MPDDKTQAEIKGSTLDPNNKDGFAGLGLPDFGSYSTTAHVITISLTQKF